jgi:hypothetical protein
MKRSGRPHLGDFGAPRVGPAGVGTTPGTSGVSRRRHVASEGPNQRTLLGDFVRRSAWSRSVVALTGAILLACGTPPDETAADRRAAEQTQATFDMRPDVRERRAAACARC